MRAIVRPGWIAMTAMGVLDGSPHDLRRGVPEGAAPPATAPPAAKGRPPHLDRARRLAKLNELPRHRQQRENHPGRPARLPQPLRDPAR